MLLKNPILIVIFISITVLVSANVIAEEAAILYQPNPDSPIGVRNPKADPALDEYAFLIGDWDATITWQPPGGKAVTYDAKWHNHWIIDGYAVMQEWRGPYLTGTEIRYYDPKTKQWIGRNLYVNGEWKEVTAQWKDGKMVVTILDAKDASGSFLNRETYFDIEENHFKMKSDRSYDEGTSWVDGRYHMDVVRTK